MAELDCERFRQFIPGAPEHLRVYVIPFRAIGTPPGSYLAAKALSRALATQLLADAIGSPSRSVVLPPSPPYIVGECRYSLSRTTEVMALSVSTLGARTGVDIEQVQTPTQAAQLIEVFHPADIARLRGLLRRPRRRSITQAWTHKEALLKGLEVGLARDPAEDEIGSLSTPRAPAGWQLRPIPLPRRLRHRASVAWEG